MSNFLFKRNQSERGRSRSMASTVALSRAPLALGSKKDLYGLVPSYQLPKDYDMISSHIFFPVISVAIQEGNLEDLSKYFQLDPDLVEFTDPQSKTSFLHVASKYPNRDLWEMLVTQKIFKDYIDRRDSRGTTPLIAACWYENRYAVSSLVDAGARPDPAITDNGRTALHFCATHEASYICEMVLTDPRCRSVVDLLDNQGQSPLMVAVEYKSPCIDCLISDGGADPLLTNPRNGRNLFHIAAVFSNNDFLKYLLDQTREEQHLNSHDLNGDTPLGLAVAVNDEYAVELILESSDSRAEVLLEPCQKHIHGLINKNQLGTLKVISWYAPSPRYFEIFDSKGRTPLLLAVQKKKTSIIKLFHEISVNFTSVNSHTSDSVLHVAAHTLDEMTIKTIFRYISYEKLSIIENNMGLTADEIILSNATYEVWKLWKQNSQLAATFENSSEESALFIAAKAGNYMLLMVNLLSNKFHSYFDAKQAIVEEDLLLFELKRIVYASDVFVTLGLLSGYRGWEKSPKQDHLFKKNARGMNIFHACALGGDIDCLRMIYNYCIMFKMNSWQLDEGDENGNTPLFYAVVYEKTEIVKYLLKHGCNMCHPNVLGWKPMHAIASNDIFSDVLEEAINHCAKTQEPFRDFCITYDIFQTENSNQMLVLSSMFAKLRNIRHVKILTNPVVEYFIAYKWSKIKHIVSLKLFVNVMQVFSFNLYLSLNLCPILTIAPEIIVITRWFTILFACLLIILNIPTLFYQGSKQILFVLAPLQVLAYLSTKETTKTALEFGAITVLISWFMMLRESHVTKMSYQMAILQKILHDVMKLMPLVVVVLLGFSLCFFTLFHEYYEYNNPLHAFITVAIHGRQGSMEVPTFTDNEQPMDSRHVPAFPSPSANSKATFTKTELRDIMVEGSLLFVFRLMVILCAFNLLVDAAIKGVTDAEQTGKLEKLKNYVSSLAVWEAMCDSRTYKTLKSLRLTWIMGLPQTLEEEIRIPTRINPLNNPVPDFDVSTLQWVNSEMDPDSKTKRFFNQVWAERHNQDNIDVSDRYSRHTTRYKSTSVYVKSD